MLRILGWEGADSRTSGNFYKVEVKANLMPRSETWVTPHRVGRTLGGCHNRLALRIAKIQPRRDIMGRWVYPPLDEAMTTVGLEELETYVLQRHNTVVA